MKFTIASVACTRCTSLEEAAHEFQLQSRAQGTEVIGHVAGSGLPHWLTGFLLISQINKTFQHRLTCMSLQSRGTTTFPCGRLSPARIGWQALSCSAKLMSSPSVVLTRSKPSSSLRLLADEEDEKGTSEQRVSER